MAASAAFLRATAVIPAVAAAGVPGRAADTNRNRTVETIRSMNISQLNCLSTSIVDQRRPAVQGPEYADPQFHPRYELPGHLMGFVKNRSGVSDPPLPQ